MGFKAQFEEVVDCMSEKVKENSELEDTKSNLDWYIVHTYSGQENRAKENLLERARQYNLLDFFGDILIPVESVSIFKGGKKKEQTRKCFPGYIVVQMLLNDETEHLIKNTPKVTGFVGSGKTPPKLRAKEIERLKGAGAEVIHRHIEVEYALGDQVRVIEGPFANFNGSVAEVKPEKKKVRVMVSIFGRSTPVELDYSQLEPLE